MTRRPFTRDDWKRFGEEFGWTLESCRPDSAEFRVPNCDTEQGFEFAEITDKVRRDILDAMQERASEAASDALRDRDEERSDP